MEEWERLLYELRAEFLLREQELELLHEIDLRMMASDMPLEQTFSFTINRTQALLGSEHTHVLLRRGRALETVYTTGESDLGQRLPLTNTLTGQCFTENATINVADLTDETYRDRYVQI